MFLKSWNSLCHIVSTCCGSVLDVCPVTTHTHTPPHSSLRAGSCLLPKPVTCLMELSACVGPSFLLLEEAETSCVPHRGDPGQVMAFSGLVASPSPGFLSRSTPQFPGVLWVTDRDAHRQV